MHKDCRNSWKCKKNKITVRHEGVFLGCRKIQILSAADLQEVWVYSKAQARWNMLPKKLFTKKYIVENGMHYMVCSLHFEFSVVERNKKKDFFFPSLCTVLTKYKLGGTRLTGQYGNVTDQINPHLSTVSRYFPKHFHWTQRFS